MTVTGTSGAGASATGRSAGASDATRAARRLSFTSFSNRRTLPALARSSHAPSVSGVATEATVRALVQASDPSATASRTAGSSSSCRASLRNCLVLASEKPSSPAA